jgi:hypothetical protein
MTLEYETYNIRIYKVLLHYCEWDSRAKDKHYSVKHWGKRQKLTPGERNVVHDPLVVAAEVFFAATPNKTWFSKKFCQSNEEGWPCFFFKSAAEFPPLE